MAEQFVIGVDLGTGGCKVSCMSDRGRLAAEAYVPYPSYYDQPQWVEQDPEAWVRSAAAGIRQTVNQLSSEERARIRCLGFSGAHHNAVLLDADYRPIRRTIMWNDQRSGKEAAELNRKFGEELFRMTKNRPTPTWTLCHLAWLREHEPDTYQDIKHILFMKDYVRYRFSGAKGTDYIEAEGTMLFDMNTREWSEEICGWIGLDIRVLPEIHRPGDIRGTLLPGMAAETGLPAGIPVIMGTVDSAAEIYGCGAVGEGQGLVKLATAGNYALVLREPPPNPTILTYEHVIEGYYYCNSATNFAAASYRWFKESFLQEFEANCAPASVYEAVNREIERIRPGSDGLVFHPYLNGERSPHWDSELRGSFFGVTARHHRFHFARAVLEGVAFSIRDSSLEFKSGAPASLKIIGGGAKGRVWTQIVSDVLNTELHLPMVTDASYGLCMVIGTAIGWFADYREAVSVCQRVVDRIEPRAEAAAVYDELFGIYRELHARTFEISHRLSRLDNRLL